MCLIHSFPMCVKLSVWNFASAGSVGMCRAVTLLKLCIVVAIVNKFLDVVRFRSATMNYIMLVVNSVSFFFFFFFDVDSVT